MLGNLVISNQQKRRHLKFSGKSSSAIVIMCF